MIKNLEQALKIMNKETVVVPGHGEITNYDTRGRDFSFCTLNRLLIPPPVPIICEIPLPLNLFNQSTILDHSFKKPFLPK